MTDKELLAMCDEVLDDEPAFDEFWREAAYKLATEFKRRLTEPSERKKRKVRELYRITDDDNFGNKQLLKDIAPHSHMIDIRVRMNGKYYWFEGDFLKQIFPYVIFVQVDNDIKTKLENHEERNS